MQGGFNTYSYVLANPLRGYDPYGLDLALIGEPGKLGPMLNLAAKTWDAENCGCNEIVEVGSGREAIEAIEDYARRNGGVDGLRVFAHSGSNGVYFDQSNSYASLYSSGIGYLYSLMSGVDGMRITEIDPDLFLPNAVIDLRGCKAGQGDNSFAQSLADHLRLDVMASQSGTQFSAVPNGRPGEGLPDPVPDGFQPLYLVPDVAGNGFKNYTPRP